jgi:hypothetical protein
MGGASPASRVPGARRDALCGLASVRLAVPRSRDGVTRSCGTVRRVVLLPDPSMPLRRRFRLLPRGVSKVFRRPGDPPTIRVGGMVVKPQTTTCSGVMGDRIATYGFRAPPCPVAAGPRSRVVRPRSGPRIPPWERHLSTVAGRLSTERAFYYPRPVPEREPVLSRRRSRRGRRGSRKPVPCRVPGRWAWRRVPDGSRMRPAETGVGIGSGSRSVVRAQPTTETALIRRRRLRRAVVRPVGGIEWSA